MEKKKKSKSLRYKKSNKDLDILASSVIHDLSNQFTMLGAEIDLLTDNCDKNKNKDIIITIEEVREQISALLHSFLRYLKDVSVIDFKEYDTKDQIKEMSKILNFKNRVNIKIKANKVKIKHISKADYNSLILNLISNAIDAVKTVENPEINIRSFIDNEEYIFEIRDNGIGLPKYYNRIFSPYFSTKGENGNGLGLYNSKRIVEKYNGKIKASRLKDGSLFYFRIPLT